MHVWWLQALTGCAPCACHRVLLLLQIGLDSGNPHMALYQCFYRFREYLFRGAVATSLHSGVACVSHRIAFQPRPELFV